MYRILKKNIGNIILISTLYIIILFFSLGVSYLKDYKDNIYEQQYYIGENSISFNISSNEEIDYKDIIKVISENTNYNIFNTQIMSNQFICNGLYMKENIKVTPRIMEGRFFNKDDFKSYKNDNLAVIGKGLLDKTIIENGERYITHNDNRYKIIGIMGDKDSQRMFDYTMMFNFNESNYINDYTNLSENWYMSTDDLEIDFSNVLTGLNKKINSNGLSAKLIEVSKNYQPNPIVTTLQGSKNITIYFGSFIIAIVMNIFILLIQWIKNLEREIGVRKAFGANDLNIYRIIFGKYVSISIAASILAMVTQYILIKFNFLEVNLNVTITNFIGTLIFSFIFSEILILISIRRLNRIEANNIMKGYR